MPTMTVSKKQRSLPMSVDDFGNEGNQCHYETCHEPTGYEIERQYEIREQYMDEQAIKIEREM